MNKIEEILLQHCTAYPALGVTDLFKLLYQSAFGCEHLAPLPDAAESLIKKETAVMSPVDGALVVPLAGAYSRVSLTYLAKGLSAATLARLLCLSASREPGGRERLLAGLAVARALSEQGRLPISTAVLAAAERAWESEGYPPVHHSDAYHRAYRPAYRVIANEYVPLLPLLARLDRMLAEGRVCLAVEGGSASGKTTLGALLSELYGATVLHTDDFFLRPEQRTHARLAEVGGNIDRERFLAEVLTPLGKGEEIAYRRFDCSAMCLLPPVRLTPARLTVVEGAYSMHPAFGRYYDLSVFLGIGEEKQRERIRGRNPTLSHRFFGEWIPMERRYFEKTSLPARCDLHILT